MKFDRAERTRLEMEAGRRTLRLQAHIERVSEQAKILQKAFPTVVINCTILAPYEDVTIQAYREGNRVLIEVDSLEAFPSDEIVAKLALIS